MRPSGLMHPTDNANLVPDYCATFIMTGASSAQASDWFVSTGAAPNAAAAGVGLVRFTPFSTLGSPMVMTANLESTNALAASASGTSLSSGPGVSVPIVAGRTFQVPGGSTGFSIASLSSGNCMVEAWRK